MKKILLMVILISSALIADEADKNFNAPAYAATETSAISKLADELSGAYKDGKKMKL